MATEAAPSHANRYIDQNDLLLDVKNLKMHFPVTAGFLIQRKVADNKAVDGVTFDIKRGETLGLVGESGCGKSTTGRAILQLYKPTSGEVIFNGLDLTKQHGKELRANRRKMQMVFQNPATSFNPTMTIGQTLVDAMRLSGHLTVRQKEQRALALLDQMELDERFVALYPYEMSGGQLQRVMIARALVVGPELLIADEPTSMLDASLRVTVLNLLRDAGVQAGDRVVMVLGREIAWWEVLSACLRMGAVISPGTRKVLAPAR